MTARSHSLRRRGFANRMKRSETVKIFNSASWILHVGVTPLNKVGLSGNPSNTSAGIGEDIPQAVRDTPEAPAPSTSKPLGAIVIFAGAGAIALASGLWFILSAQTPRETAIAPSSNLPDPATPSAPSDSASSEAPENPLDRENVLGHLPYEQAPLEELEPITGDGSIQMRRAAARAFLKMKADAAAQGIYLAVISGFRTIEDQQYLFFDIKAQRGQIARERAEVSAPPGYSEHHTGYAVDIGDANVPATHLSPDFEKTAAFQWLAANAPYYSFELSFPKDNPQGVAYEPWHWRFVGDRHSLETFYKAHEIQPQTP